MLPPASEAVCPGTPVAGEHWWEAALALLAGLPWGSWQATARAEWWSQEASGLVQLQGSSEVLDLLDPCKEKQRLVAKVAASSSGSPEDLILFGRLEGPAGTAFSNPVPSRGVGQQAPASWGTMGVVVAGGRLEPRAKAVLDGCLPGHIQRSVSPTEAATGRIQGAPPRFQPPRLAPAGVRRLVRRRGGGGRVGPGGGRGSSSPRDPAVEQDARTAGSRRGRLRFQRNLDGREALRAASVESREGRKEGEREREKRGSRQAKVMMMLSDKVEKRIASSIFITLAPPKRDSLLKSETKPQKAPLRPSNHLPKEALKPTGPAPSPASAGAIKGSRGSLPGAAGIPNGGCSALPPPPTILPGNPVDTDMDSLFPSLPLPPPPPTYSNPFSVEMLNPDFQKQTAVLPGSLQTSLTFPAELKQPKILPSTLGWADELQTERKVENTVSKDICAFCRKAISPRTPTLEAMNKQYHTGCFTCRTCHCTLAGQRFYQKEGRPLCVACYQNTLEKCATCQALILDQIVRAMGHGYHPECFTCVACGRAIGNETFAVGDNNEVHCLDDFYRKFASVCGACEKPIIPSDGRDSYKIECMGRNFHEDCYRCERCQVLLSPEPTEDGCYPLGSRLFCKSCHIRQTKELSC